MSRSPSNLLVWFGVLGGPLAWAVQFVINLEFSFAQCDTLTRWHLPLRGWQIATSVAALAIGAASTAVAWRLYRQTDVRDVSEKVRRGFGGEPPTGRVHFLAVVGLVVNFLSLTIVVMTGIGAPLLTQCQQS
jgi:hypothetical protein